MEIQMHVLDRGTVKTRSPPGEQPDGDEAPSTVSPVTEHLDVESNGSAQLTQAQPQPQPQPQWQSWKLRPWWMIILLFVEVALIVFIICLERISAGHDGIASIPQISDSGFAIANIWRYGLLWTTLPSLVMAIYALMWGTVVSGTADRQPFVELRRSKEKAASAKITIMLDYRAYPALYNWIVAFGNGHILICFAMFLNFLFPIVIVPLSAHLFVAAQSDLNSTVHLNFPTLVNESTISTLQPAIDLANAIRTYGANPPPWMTVEYAFEAFFTADETTPGNLSSETNAYSAYLDCETFSPNDAAAYDEGFVRVNMNDRGCQVSPPRFRVANSTQTYVHSWNVPCSGSDYGRIGLSAGVYSEESPLKIANLSIISCIPSYWNTSGSITFSVRPNVPSQFISFTPGKSNRYHPTFYVTLEMFLHVYTFFDPSSTFSADAFGFAVFNYAKSQNSTSPIQAHIIKSSAENLFTTLYASLVNTQMFSQASTPRTAQGTLTTAVTRLFVVTSIAYTVVGVLCLMLVCNIFLLVHARRNDSILYEEPIGLLGFAVLLGGSNLLAFVETLRENRRNLNNIREIVKENYEADRSKCWWEDGTIMIQGLVEKKGQ